MTETPSKVELPPRTVNIRLGRVEGPEGVVSLTTKEAEVMTFLAAHPGRSIPREEFLTEVWGFRGSVITRAVDNTVRRLRGKVEQDPANPRYILTVHGYGYRFEPPESEASAEPPPPRAVVAQQVLTDPTGFVGRVAELQSLKSLLSQGTPFITLLGTGGAGKTRLARRLLVDFQAAKSERTAVFCDLSRTRNALDAVRVISGVLGITLSEAASPEMAVLQALRQRGPLLLVLDSFEHLVAEAADLVACWIGGVPTLQLLLTSQQPLRHPEEVVIDLPPLSRAEGVTLFLERSRKRGRAFDATEKDREVIGEIVTHLDGLPLAIELAAARTRVLSPATILERLVEPLDLLDGDPASGRGRGTLRRTIDASWALLNGAEQLALAQCAVFEQGFPLDAAEAVVCVEEGASAVLDLVEALCDRSLLYPFEPVGLNGEVWFRLYHTIRDYAREHLEPSDGSFQRHAQWWVDAAQEWSMGLTGLEGGECRVRMVLAMPDLLAIQQRQRTVEPTLSVRVITALSPLLLSRGVDGQQAVLFAEALEDAEAIGDPKLSVAALTAYAELRRTHGDVANALSTMDRAIELARGANLSASIQAKVLVGQGTLLLQTRQWERATSIFEDVLTIVDPGDQRIRGIAHKGLGELARMQGEHRRARGLFETALGFLCAQGDRAAYAGALCSLANLQVQRGEVEEAEKCYREAWGLYTALRDRRCEGVALSNLALVMHERGNLVEAEALGKQALSLHREVQNPRFEAFTLSVLGSVRHHRGDLYGALGSLRMALTQFRTVQDMQRVGICLSRIGAVFAELGEIDAALQSFAEARAELTEPVLLCGLDVLEGFLDLTRSSGEDEHLAAARRRLELSEGQESSFPRIAVAMLRSRLEAL